VAIILLLINPIRAHSRWKVIVSNLRVHKYKVNVVRLPQTKSVPDSACITKEHIGRFNNDISSMPAAYLDAMIIHVLHARHCETVCVYVNVCISTHPTSCITTSVNPCSITLSQSVLSASDRCSFNKLCFVLAVPLLVLRLLLLL
jgi:hypothetical protein